MTPAYQLHGVRLSVVATGEAERAAAGVRSRLAGLPAATGLSDLTFEVTASVAHPFERPAGARPVYDPPLGEVIYDDASDRLYIGHGPRLAVLCEPGRGWTRASMAGTNGREEADLWTLSHPLFTLPLVEMLKRRGLYGLHAGGVCRDGRALLLPGTSGSGKTTLTLALARAGFGFLGDDTLFLRRRPEGIEVLAFPDELDLTDETVAFFPELRSLLDTERREGWRKRPLRPDGVNVVWQAAPALLVFPQVAGVPESRLTPMDRGEALLELAPNVLLTEPCSAQAHLDALAGLVEKSECWRLATGRDLDEAVRRLVELLDPASELPRPRPSPLPLSRPHARERGTRLGHSCCSPSSPGEGDGEGTGEEGRGDEGLGRGSSEEKSAPVGRLGEGAGG